MDTVTPKKPPYGYEVDHNGAIASRAWDIIAGSAAEAISILASQVGVQRGSIYKDEQGQEPDAWCRCQRITARGHPPAPVGGTGLYEVVAYYGWPMSRTEQQVTRTPGEEPRWWVETTPTTVPFDYDFITKKPLVNSADEPFEAQTCEVAMHTLIGEWTEQAASYSAIFQKYRPYIGKVNKTTFAGAEPRCLRCTVIDIDYADIEGVYGQYFRVKPQFSYQPPQVYKWTDDDGILQETTVPGWDILLKDVGYRKKVGTDPETGLPIYELILDHNGQPVNRPVNLNGQGSPAKHDAYPLVFRCYEEAEFHNDFPEPD